MAGSGGYSGGSGGYAQQMAGGGYAHTASMPMHMQHPAGGSVAVGGAHQRGGGGGAMPGTGTTRQDSRQGGVADSQTPVQGPNGWLMYR